MAEIDYAQIGNVREDYKHEPRITMLQGLVASPSLVLKMYSMLRNVQPDDKTVDAAKKFLRREIDGERISPEIGLGFAILSEDMLNVARWGTEYPIVLKNQIYGFEEGDIRTAKPLDTRDVGCFCIWELGIVHNEREAWKRFLASGRGRTDKEKYLDDMVGGRL